MKDILIVVSPSKNADHPVYMELRTEAQKYGKEAQRILYTTYLLTGPRSFETAMSLERLPSKNELAAARFQGKHVATIALKLTK